MKKIALVTVLYKSDEVLEEFFRSLAIQSFNDYHLYLIDNSPSLQTDQLCADLLARYNSVSCTHLKNSVNIGVAAANNIGIEQGIEAGSAYTILLNNDIVFSDADLLLRLYNQATENKEYLIVPKILYYGTTKIWMAGGKFHKGRALTEHIGDLEENGPQFDVPSYVSYAPTCFMWIDNRVFKAVGLMRPEYFVYYDDTDFIYRAIKAGYQVYYMPRLTIEHKISTATGGMQSLFSIYYMTRNRLFFIRNNYFGISFAKAVCLSVYDGFRIARRLYNRQQWQTFLKGVLHGLIK